MEGQRYLRLRSERRVATGENQPKAIVGNLAGVVIRRLDGGDQAAGSAYSTFQLFPGQRPMPNAVDGFVPGRLDNPGAGEFRYAGDRPLVHGSRKSFLRRLFRQVEVADEPDQGGDDPAPIRAVYFLNGRSGVRRHT